MTGTHRLLEVDAHRLPRWVAGFGDRHGAVTASTEGETLRLEAADGAVAVLGAPFGGTPPADVDAGTAWLVEQTSRDRAAAVLLVRRGGYAVATATGDDLTSHKVGTRYVQGRTAAGGWSQQRFARRRAGQAAGLVGAAADAAHATWSSGSSARPQPRPEVLVVGGDRTLVAQVLDDSRLRRVAELPRSPLLDVRDPRLDVLREALHRSRCVRIGLTEPV